MAPVFMVLDHDKDNSLIYYAIKSSDPTTKLKQIKIQQFDPDEGIETCIRNLAVLSTPNILYFQQHGDKFIIIDIDANIVMYEKVNNKLR